MTQRYITENVEPNEDQNYWKLETNIKITNLVSEQIDNRAIWWPIAFGRHPIPSEVWEWMRQR